MFSTRRSRPTGSSRTRSIRLLAISSSALLALADCILHPAIVLAAIAFLLNGSSQQIAAFSVISIGAWTLTPVLLLILGNLTRYTGPITLAALVVRVGAVLVLGWTALHLDDWSTDRVLSFLTGSYLAYQVSSALVAQSSLNQGTMVQTARGVGRGLAWRNVGMIAAGLLAAWATWSQLSADVPIQDSLSNLLLLAAIAVGSASLLRFFLLTSRSPLRSASSVRPGVAIRSAAASSAVRRFLAFRTLLALVAAFDPFLLWYGFDRLSLELKYVGMALLAWAAGQAIGLVIWPWLTDRIGSRIPLQIATTLRLMLLVLVVSIPELATSTAYTDRFDGPEAAFSTFALSFVLLGLATSAGNSANQRYIMDVSSSSTVAGLTICANVVAGVFAFAPLAVAWALDTWTIDRVFWGAIAAAVVALLVSGLLPNARVRVRPNAGAWRKRAASQPV